MGLAQVLWRAAGVGKRNPRCNGMQEGCLDGSLRLQTVAQSVTAFAGKMSGLCGG